MPCVPIYLMVGNEKKLPILPGLASLNALQKNILALFL